MPLTTYTAGEVLTAASLNSNFSFAAGGTVQVKSTTKTDTFTMSSTTFADVTGLSVSITPTSASNKILVIVSMACSSSASELMVARLMRGSTAIAIGDAAGLRTQASSSIYTAATSTQTSMAISFLDSPSTTSATTYKMQIAVGSGAHQVNVNRCNDDANRAQDSRTASTITVMEVTT